MERYSIIKKTIWGNRMKEYPEQHQQGKISIENREMFKESVIDGDIGVQISRDGRIWVCINGIAFLRFKPKKAQGSFPSLKKKSYDEGEPVTPEDRFFVTHITHIIQKHCLDKQKVKEVVTAYLCKYVCRDEKIKKLRDGILKELGLSEVKREQYEKINIIDE